MATENEDPWTQQNRPHHCGRFSISNVNNKVGTMHDQNEPNNFDTNNDSHAPCVPIKIRTTQLSNVPAYKSTNNNDPTNDPPYGLSDIKKQQSQKFCKMNNEDSPYSIKSIEYSTQQHTGIITPFTQPDDNPTPHSSKSLELHFPETNINDSPIDEGPMLIAHIHERPHHKHEITSSKSFPQLMPRTSILTILTASSSESINEQMIETQCLNENGYAKMDKICDTMNGEVFDAKHLTKHGCNVVIKKTYKSFHYGMSIVLKETVFKEALILHHLSVVNKPTNGHMAKYIHFFESDDAYYLVMKKAGSINLAEYNKKAHALIAEKKLKIKHWRKIVKCIFWQLSVIMHWLHNDMKCCHLDLNLSNIVLLNSDFIQHKQTGKYIADPNLQVKLVDFGAAEIFESKHKNTLFKCMKQVFKKRNYLSAPNVYANQMYDAEKADIWCMGIMLYELVTGLEPYKSQNIGQDVEFCMVLRNNFKGLLRRQNKTKNVNNLMLTVMSKMLNIREKDRIIVRDVLEDDWLRLYWNRYKTQVDKKSEFQAIRNKTLHKKMQQFPYYNL